MPDEKKELITDVPTLQQMITERNEKLEKLRLEKTERDAELEKFRKAEADRVTKEKADQDKLTQDQLAKQGQYEQALKTRDETWTKKDQEKTEKFAKKLVPAQVQAALAKTPIIPQALKDAADFMESRIGIDQETFDPYVKGPDGKPLVNKDTMARVSIEDFAKQWVEERPHFKLDQMTTTTGHKSGEKGSLTTNPKYTLENAAKDKNLLREWQKEDPKGFSQAIAQAERDKYAALRAKGKA